MMGDAEPTYEPTHGSIVHIELYSDDIDATQAFYEEAFGWTFESVDGMDYLLWEAPDPPSGGLMATEDVPETPPSTLFYIDVEDLAATREAVSTAGGRIFEEEMAVQDMGVFAVFGDPGGVVEAAWEDTDEGEPPDGGWPQFTDRPAPGSIVHFELYSDDVDATRRFHESVFDWNFEEVEGEYVMARPPTPPFGGVMPASDDMPVGSLAYVLVARAEDACRTIETAGGAVLREPFEVGEWGTMAVFEAPGGIVQAVWENATDQAESRRASESATP